MCVLNKHQDLRDWGSTAKSAYKSGEICNYEKLRRKSANKTNFEGKSEIFPNFKQQLFKQDDSAT
jgi:hypothetical protein